MTSNQKLKQWLESLPKDKYTLIIQDVFAGAKERENDLLKWLCDGIKIPLFAKCCIEKVSEKYNVPFSFGELEVFLFKKMLDDIWRFVDTACEDDPEEAKQNFARPIILFQAFHFDLLFNLMNKSGTTKKTD